MSLAERIEQKAKRWAARKQTKASNTHTVSRRQLYILPTAQGMAFAVMLLVMLLASMNYNNNLGFLFTFLLMGLGIVSMHQANANVRDLVVQVSSVPPVFAGEVAVVNLHVSNPTQRARFGIRCMSEGVESDAIDIASYGDGRLTFDHATLRRGEYVVQAPSLISRYPMTLFHVWSWCFLDAKMLVYPKPMPKAPALPQHHQQDSGPQFNPQAGEEDFLGLRKYRPGDPPKRLAWKAMAKQGKPLTKEFAATHAKTLWLDWDATEGHVENRLSTLCAWILECQKDHLSFGMRLPHTTVELGGGHQHITRCLTLLARF